MILDEVIELTGKYRNKGILVDTNLLILYFVGILDRDRIARFKRTQQFSAGDFERLALFIQNSQNWIVTPYVLTEVSSLLNSLGEPERERGLLVLAEGIKTSVEEYCPSRNLCVLNGFERYGLADLSIKEAAADQKYLVLTDDLELYVHLLEHEVDAINFNHIRF